MEIAVLLKAVPRAEELRFEPDRRTVVREGAELVPNPFDQRALRVAIGLRRAGDRLTSLSLGPPAVGPLLRESVAAGADRAWHLCDARFAGSDLLATAFALSTAVRRLGASLVLAGTRSTDSDTGLVGPEIAARLGMPVVTGARRVRWTEGADVLEVDLDSPVGEATVQVTPPAVVTVGEKAGKPIAVPPEAFAATSPARVEVLGPEALGLPAAEIGFFGSPTTVEAVRTVAPVRAGPRLTDGSVRERVAKAVAILTPLLGAAPREPTPLPWPPSRDPDRELVVLATGADGGLGPEALGLLGDLRRALPAFSVTAAAFGTPLAASDQGRLAAAGAVEGFQFETDGRSFDSSDVAQGLAALLDRRSRLAGLVAPSTAFGREVAGQLAASRRLGVVADATGVETGPAGELSWTKPSFGGSTLATVRSRSRPTIVTMPAGLGSSPSVSSPTRTIPWSSMASPAPRRRVVPRAIRPEPAPGAEPDRAEVVVAVGTGIGGPEGIARLEPALERWNAALVGTRRVVDAGWLPSRRQVGLTGRLLAPRLAILLGVRGAPHHMVGWSRARAVLAVNRDPEAAVFGAADVGIVGGWEELLPELLEPIAPLAAGSP